MENRKNHNKGLRGQPNRSYYNQEKNQTTNYLLVIPHYQQELTSLVAKKSPRIQLRDSYQISEHTDELLYLMEKISHIHSKFCSLLTQTIKGRNGKLQFINLNSILLNIDRFTSLSDLIESILYKFFFKNPKQVEEPIELNQNTVQYQLKQIIKFEPSEGYYVIYHRDQSQERIRSSYYHYRPDNKFSKSNDQQSTHYPPPPPQQQVYFTQYPSFQPPIEPFKQVKRNNYERNGNPKRAYSSNSPQNSTNTTNTEIQSSMVMSYERPPNWQEFPEVTSVEEKIQQMIVAGQISQEQNHLEQRKLENESSE